MRGAVASSSFDDFHKNSSEIIRFAVFGRDSNGEIKEKVRQPLMTCTLVCFALTSIATWQFVFPNNKLVITNIDIQSVEPVDQRTRY